MPMLNVAKLDNLDSSALKHEQELEINRAL